MKEGQIMNSIPLIHYKKDQNSLLNTYFLVLIPLIIFSFYKNGLLLYQNNLIPFKSLFIPLYFYLISIIVGLAISLLFKEPKKNNILICLILSLSVSINTNMLIYPILLFIMLVLTKYLKTKLKIPFNDLALIRLFLILSLLLNSYSYLNIAEKLHKFNYNLFDTFLGFAKGGLATSSLLILLICLLILSFNKYYKKYIAISSSLAFFLTTLIYSNLTNNPSLLASVFNGTPYFGFIFLATSLEVSPSSYKGMFIYGLFIGILTSFFVIFFNFYEASYLSIFLISFLIPLINQWTNKKYLQT